MPREPIAPKTRAEIFTATSVTVPTYKETLPGGVTHTIIEVEGDNGFYDDIRDDTGKPRFSTCRRTIIS